MKVHLFNFFLLVTVGSCLFITLSRAAPEARPVSEVYTAFITLSPTATPHPMDAYQEKRMQDRQTAASALEALLSSPDETLQLSARQELLLLADQTAKETQTEGFLTGMGFERSLCILQNGQVFLFTKPTVAPEDAAAVLEGAARICGVEKEKVQFHSP